MICGTGIKIPLFSGNRSQNFRGKVDWNDLKVLKNYDSVLSSFHVSILQKEQF